MTNLSPIHESDISLVNDYIVLLEGSEDWGTKVSEQTRENLTKFSKLTVERILNGELPDDKMGRWIGFLEGSLFIQGYDIPIEGTSIINLGKDQTTGIQDLHIELLKYYIELLEGVNTNESNIIELGKLTIKEVNDCIISDNELGKRVGFIQSILVHHEIITVEGERNRTRPLFHEVYKEIGIPLPETKEI